MLINRNGGVQSNVFKYRNANLMIHNTIFKYGLTRRAFIYMVITIYINKTESDSLYRSTIEMK